MFIFAIVPYSLHTPVEEVLDKLKSVAIHIKVESSLNRGGAVRIEDAVTALTSILSAYKSFIEVKYNPLNTQIEPAKYKKQMAHIETETNLFIVDLDFKSFGATVAPNTADYKYKIPHVPDTTKWKKEAFEEFKHDVFQQDYNDAAFLKRITGKYTPLQRYKIYKPIVEGIIANKDVKVQFGFKPAKLIPFKKTSPNTLKQVVPDLKADLPKQDDDKFLATAQVEVSSSGATKPKVLDIFTDTPSPILQFDQVDFGGRTYIFRDPLYYIFTHQKDFYSLESKHLGIYTQGKTREEATLEFFEEFDHIYMRYNELPEEQLTEDVVRIKRFLLALVIQ